MFGGWIKDIVERTIQTAAYHERERGADRADCVETIGILEDPGL